VSVSELTSTRVKRNNRPELKEEGESVVRSHPLSLSIAFKEKKRNRNRFWRFRFVIRAQLESKCEKVSTSCRKMMQLGTGQVKMKQSGINTKPTLLSQPKPHPFNPEGTHC